MQISDLLKIGRGVTALIGGGGKTTLLCRLAEELKKKGTVILATSTKMYPPQQYPLLTEGSEEALRAALKAHGVVAVGTVNEEGKLSAPECSFEALAELADYVLVEADGSRGLPLKAHAHRADDICTSIRIAKEFGVKLTLEHCTEGHLIPEIVARSGCPAAVGPTLTNASKIELCNKTFETPGVLDRAGVQVSIITDSPVIPQQYLPLCAGLAIKAGMDSFSALKAITINPAKHLGIEDRVGSLEIGKDADIVLTNGDPMVSDNHIVAVVLNGEKVVG